MSCRYIMPQYTIISSLICLYVCLYIMTIIIIIIIIRCTIREQQTKITLEILLFQKSNSVVNRWGFGKCLITMIEVTLTCI